MRRAPNIRSSEITDERLYLSRRGFIKAASSLVGAAAGGLVLGEELASAQAAVPQYRKLPFGPLHTDEGLNSFEQITTYNNFYEFGSDKSDPARYGGRLKTRPWSVKVDGLCEKPGDYGIEEFLKPELLEERVYRMRCVEAWSMVIPWIGVPLGTMVKRFQPKPEAKFVEFTTLVRPTEMVGQQTNILEWPYVEGLRLDEAVHPLTLLAIGLYGKVLLNQNGAPLRLVVPWKYGFKGIKSIVRMRFTAKQPMNTWQRMASNEYGFYANVNPEVDHPRWSQKRERRIGEFFRRPTLMFNGYADEVAALYAGMDLRRNY